MWLGIALGVVGIVLWIPSFLPAISFGITSTLEETVPLATPFSVINSGLLDIYAVRFRCQLVDVKIERGFLQIIGIGLTDARDIADVLAPRDSYDVVCPFHDIYEPQGSVIYADIKIVAFFRPKFLPLTRVKCARFVTDRSPSGQLRWLQRPSQTCPPLE